jgi:hypothetical protein
MGSMILPTVSPLHLSPQSRTSLGSRPRHPGAFSIGQVLLALRPRPQVPTCIWQQVLENWDHRIAAWHSYSTKGTRIIAMITLTLDKHALVKANLFCENCESVAHVKGRCPLLKKDKSTYALTCGYTVDGLGFYYIPNSVVVSVTPHVSNPYD